MSLAASSLESPQTEDEESPLRGTKEGRGTGHIRHRRLVNSWSIGRGLRFRCFLGTIDFRCSSHAPRITRTFLLAYNLPRLFLYREGSWRSSRMRRAHSRDCYLLAWLKASMTESAAWYT
ncbi:hypothetical protein NL676_013557 [Syzygium grande]|nr:hypothetical protein NL676_013557 [Syzygium grande]